MGNHAAAMRSGHKRLPKPATRRAEGKHPSQVRLAITPDRARAFALLLSAGFPPATALAQVAPQIAWTKESALATGRTWSRSSLVLDALVLVHAAPGQVPAPWLTLDPDVRLVIARDKHLAALAYLLATTHYGELTAEGRDEASRAAKTLSDYLDAHPPRTDDPFTVAMRQITQERAETEAAQETLAETKALMEGILAIEPEKVN